MSYATVRRKACPGSFVRENNLGMLVDRNTGSLDPVESVRTQKLRYSHTAVCLSKIYSLMFAFHSQRFGLFVCF